MRLRSKIKNYTQLTKESMDAVIAPHTAFVRKIVWRSRWKMELSQEQDLVKKERKLLLIKAVHTVVWVFYNVVIFYLLYAVLTNRIDKWVWICLGLIALEGLVLLVFNKMCPITVVARRYSDSNRDNFDIFLPNWLARHNKAIYTSIVLISVLILIYRLVLA
ncbi:hypothetical protein SAMN05444128_1304 [Pontibacter indicus]|uniref:DUF2784 domain-containing protein n=2 Tax=Pontibacter indicus TaxID=1317125 RepID=A0A1R3WZ05_9BACT|nr:hypothetical protein SAMN05444128_1304 [Pontibacter indicus]